MRLTRSAFVRFIALVIFIAGITLAEAQQPKPEPANSDKQKSEKLKIVPLVVLKPGEQKELILSTECTVGATRGGGFNLMEIGSKGEGSVFPEVKVWKRNGVVVEAPDFETGEKQASAPEYKLLREAGVNVFSVKVTAEKDAKPGVYNMHLVDQTCSGWCTTDFRVLIVAR